MICLRVDDEGFLFRIGHREKRALSETLKLYPLIPATYHRIARDGVPGQLAEAQQLLDEALAARKRENRRQLRAMLDQPARFQAGPKGYQFKLTRGEAEWLLQVLNDVRVGSWLQLGCPDENRGGHAPLNEENARFHLAKEVAAHFQMALLAAFAQPSSSGHGGAA
jgi:hypothetical protein